MGVEVGRLFASSRVDAPGSRYRAQASTSSQRARMQPRRRATYLRNGTRSRLTRRSPLVASGRRGYARELSFVVEERSIARPRHHEERTLTMVHRTKTRWLVLASMGVGITSGGTALVACGDDTSEAPLTGEGGVDALRDATTETPVAPTVPKPDGGDDPRDAT